jgi:hypothetical protein
MWDFGMPVKVISAADVTKSLCCIDNAVRTEVSDE